MANVNEMAEPGVLPGVGLESVPGGNVQGGDAGLAPARGQVFEVGAEAIGGIEKRPQAARAEGGCESQVGERMQQIGEALVAMRAGGRSDPQDGAGAMAEAGQQRSASPALPGENLCGGWDFEERELERALPDHRQIRASKVLHILNPHPPARRPETESFGNRGGAFQNDESAGGGTNEPRLGGTGRPGAQHRDAGGVAGCLGLKSNR